MRTTLFQISGFMLLAAFFILARLFSAIYPAAGAVLLKWKFLWIAGGQS